MLYQYLRYNDGNMWHTVWVIPLKTICDGSNQSKLGLLLLCSTSCWSNSVWITPVNFYLQNYLSKLTVCFMDIKYIKSINKKGILLIFFPSFQRDTCSVKWTGNFLSDFVHDLKKNKTIKHITIFYSKQKSIDHIKYTPDSVVVESVVSLLLCVSGLW